MSGKWSLADFLQIGVMLVIGWYGATVLNKVWGETLTAASTYLK